MGGGSGYSRLSGVDGSVKLGRSLLELAGLRLGGLSICLSIFH